MKLLAHLLALAGILLAIGLVAYYGVDSVGEALLSAGWGILVVALFHLVPMAFSTQGWRVLMAPQWPGSFLAVYYARWIRESVNSLLPVAQVGGDIVGARVLTFNGAPARLATAGVVVDLTVELVTQFIFTLMGLGLLVLIGADPEVVRWALVGIAVAVPAVGGFLLAQRYGLFKLIDRLLAYLEANVSWARTGSVANLHEAVLGLYRDRRALLSSGIYHLLSWVTGAAEIWLALYFMGIEVTIAEALILESLNQAIRSAAFLVPGAYGVQEGGFLVLGALFGLGPDVALALSLIRRVREFLLGLPGLAAWQLAEGRRFWLGLGRGKREAE